MNTNESTGQLLEKYWQCQTSLAEEQRLCEFFAGDNVPEEWMKYRSLFIRKKQQQAVLAEKTFELKPRFSFREQVYPALKIAASVLILIAFSISIYTHYEQEKFMDTIFTETDTLPVDSVQTPVEVVAKAVSPNWVQDKEIDNPPVILKNRIIKTE
ncbi:MAG: hypothetical protein LBG77_08025 [Dysgonamonadaceae bacterium]|jgi:hypothetical protein|nr:hypothetical protein [Dysgonamonadaceae bacterium]